MEGKAHAYVFATPGCKKWDTAAPEAIINAAGGHLTGKILSDEGATYNLCLFMVAYVAYAFIRPPPPKAYGNWRLLAARGAASPKKSKSK